jgi:ABC-type bacteriocin/lantibiotic exporter with double-glycine peptidase domain
MKKLRPELQVTSTECGLCCAAMVLHAQGCKDPTAQLREELDLGRDGATIDQLRSAFEARGITARIYRANAQGLADLSGPVIVFWQNYHFLVLLRLTDRFAHVLDPAVGRRKLTREEFADGFSHLALHPEPGRAATLYPEVARSKGSSIRRLYAQAIRLARMPLLALIACAAAAYGCMLALPILTQRFIDAAVRDPESSTLTGHLPWLLAVAVLALMGVGYLRAVCVAQATIIIGRHSAEHVMRHLLRVPLRFFDTRLPGELAYRLNGLAAIRDTLSGQVVVGVFELGAMVVFLGYLFHTSASLGWVALGVVAFLFVLQFGTRTRIYSALQNEIVQTGKSQTQQLEAIQSILTIKAEASQRFFLARWKTENDLALRYLGIRTRLQGAVSAVVSGVQVGAPLVVLIVGLGLWKDGDLTLGKVVAGQAIAISLFGSASSIYGAVTQLMAVVQYGRRLRDILDTRLTIEGTEAVASWTPLELTNVSYRYTRESPPVLRDVNLTVGRGEKVAIVGATGSGKSTLARLILGLDQPTRGTVSMGGVELERLDREALMSDISFVPQGITLESMSVRRNIDMGRDIDEGRLRRACDAACISADIEALPMGYETLVSNMGDNFSGGQKQRIGIARALVKEPSLLVMDEATSSLDHATEVAIMNAVTQMNCAAVIIAHRLASVVAADRIYVLQDGAVVAHGRHDELLERRGVYWTMFGSQMEASRVAG